MAALASLYVSEIAGCGEQDKKCGQSANLKLGTCVVV